MKYLLLLHTPDDGLPPDLGSPEYADMHARYTAAMGAMAQAGVLIECAPLHAAIAACHSTSPDAAGTDWREIAALYGELIRYEPSPVVEANRAIAVAMSEGPAAGLVILDAVGHHPQLSRWPQLHLARAELELEPTAQERDFIARRIGELRAGQ